ncbi:hypothetical protein [Lysinibacillus fusiformis]|uniref:hypothetical protein n=1 Tax=Lysinibacillus fusiformis TaxID=28031 RepID=UPI0035583D4F
MNLLLWITLVLIVVGLFVLMSKKKSMEERVAFAIENKEDSKEEKQTSTKPVVWWIVGATVWGLVSMLLIVWVFSVYV